MNSMNAMISGWLIVIFIVKSDSVNQPFRSLTAPEGGSVTLVCSADQFHPNDLFWFKHISGQAPRYIMSYTRYSQQETFYEEFENSRFHIETTNSTFNLKIEKLQPVDMATYYCGERKFGHVLLGPGTVLCLTGTATEHRRNEHPVLELALDGHNMMLSCTVKRDVYGDDHSVYWFWQNTGGLLQGISHDIVNKSLRMDKDSAKYVYIAYKHNVSTLHAGTFYCAVAMCAGIFISNGTTLHLSGDSGQHSSFIIRPMVLILALSNIVLLILVLICAVQRNSQCRQYAGNADGTAETVQQNSITNQESTEIVEVSYAALNLSHNKGKPRQKKQDSTYATLRNPQSHGDLW
ncbi:uncharacterized protein LOC120522831 [Polypterus senegalus]|uniref:uncharacterized protein LOC120522831 n=1 Tax=Polypterus senegalus TaxID=55291 RepID=UPI0019653587|nr:uncharacterized protein LOC120522831 [Polypterus senegalus]